MICGYFCRLYKSDFSTVMGRGCLFQFNFFGRVATQFKTDTDRLGLREIFPSGVGNTFSFMRGPNLDLISGIYIVNYK